MEMYLLQFNTSDYIDKFLICKHSTSKIADELEFIFKLIIIFTTGFIYKKLLKTHLTNIFDKIIISIINKV